ncbi:MAG: undecaprenyldiphospho-muramoylpentapeptide beta-N-acetylglucosaminyltransferase [Candidatus Liberibacter ctenarytainae]|uniref:UDP-N-acetylglucosamine--N-acetylmuramyl-(pentapeptide) pyrophosphoryl-undecaprenol N-acetylglucosamine transferase n=1 Tax=Candidatus Liberibacter ctenarytainae TaxID=2020335 RepID=A0A937AKW9_9HYPH|nr:undecaprenyldiphospho-muramoylpentapeptide beta-N-acetylglucosaminyltransferase [Candidatus Liberibacter ctenarytainae]
MLQKDVILLVSGGTGGHVFPAVALVHELKKRGYIVYLITDRRTKFLVEELPSDSVYEISSSQINLSNPIVFYHSMVTLWKGLIDSLLLMRKLKPKVIVGFGGYTTVSPLLAAMILRISSMIHEQNVVMGRANRLLSLGVKVIARGLFSQKKGFLSRKVITTGNPIRDSFIKAAAIPYQLSHADKPFRLLIFGGSQGAKIFSEIIPQSISLLSFKQRQRLIIIQQVKEDERESVQKYYENLGVKYELSSFFHNLEEHIAAANLLICRSGALTVSEIAAIGRPSILIPYPYAVNQDQLFNAQLLQKDGGAEVIVQDSLSPKRLAKEISSAMEHPERLLRMAQQVFKKRSPEAVLLLSDVVEQLARGKVMSTSLGRKGIC